MTVAIKCPECQTENTSDSQFCKKCATPLPPFEGVSVTKTLETPVKKLTKGTTFADRYEILEELGKGGMGEVYKVRDKKLDEEMALKVLKPEIAADKDIIERFKNELKFARKIAHRNVCKMYDLNEEEETPYITMEYVEGEDLKSYIRRKERLKEEEVIAVAKQVCEGLAEAHDLGVIHRDLKPGNIMIDEKSNAKVMDFGIARSVEAPGVTHTGVMIGTPDYMSPEQAEGEEADQRSDIYSLGVILYEMVTGSVPFKGDTAFSVALKHKTKLPSDPRKLNPELSNELSRLILICMEKDRERRYQTAEALLNDLQNIEEGLPLGTKIKPRRATFTQTLIRKKLLIPAFIILAIAIIAVLIWRLLPKKEAVPLSPSGKPSVAILYFDNFSGDESLDNWRFAFPELLITDLSQSKYIRVLRLDEINSVLKILNLTDTEKYSLENLKDISEKCRANHLLKGSYIKAGDTFKITATLISGKTAETISSLNVEAEGEKDIYAKVDDLTKEIKQNLGITPNQLADDIDMEIGNVTTQNVEALHYYIEGERYHYIYNYDKAIQSFKKAIDIDPEFAMAYRMLGACYSNKGLTEEWKNAFQKAYQLKDRLPIRERYILEGDFYLIDGVIHMDENDYTNAIEMYKKVVELYPDYYLGNHMLAMMYMRIGDWDREIEYRSKLIQNKTSMFLQYNCLAEDYSIKGEYDESVKVWEEAFKNIQKDLDLALAHEFLARVHLQESKYDLALSELDKALSIYSHPWIEADVERCKADILYFNDNMDEALKKYQSNPKYLEWMEPWMLIVNVYVSQGKMKKAIDLHNDKLQSLLKQKQTSGNKNWIRIIQESLAWFYIRIGEPELALEKLKKAYTLIDEDYPYQSQRKLNLFYQALAYIEMNQFDEALNTIEENKRVWPAIVKKSIRGDFKADIFFLKGKLALRRENIKEAIINLEKAVSLLPGEIFSYECWVHGFHALYIDSLAFAYLKNGDIDLAIENYEKIHNLTYGRFIWGDIYAKSFYTLGKLYQDKGWKGKAIESYKRFIRLWKDCDPHFQPIVEDAKKRLVGLKS